MGKLQWEDTFSSIAIQRGRNIFYRNHVRKLKYNEKNNVLSFQADVLDYNTCHVSGSFAGNYLQDISCSCLESLKANCGHMAAAILSLDYNLEIAEDRRKRKEAEEEKMRRVNTRKPIQPFKKPAGYSRYFNMEKLTADLTIYDLDYNDALKKLETLKLDFEPDFFYYTQDKYKGLIGDAQYGNASIRFTRDTILSLHCNTYGCDNYYYSWQYFSGKSKNACVHQLMLLIMLDRYLDENDVGDSTDYNAIRFLHSMRPDVIKKGASEEPGETSDVRLVPRLTKTRAGISLSFRIGKNKLYAVKSFSKLKEYVSGSKEMQLGKNAVLDFKTDSFDPLSTKYFNFIQGIVLQNEALQNNAAKSYYIPDIGASTELNGANLDSLFDLIGSNEAEYINKASGSKAKPLMLSSTDPEIHLTVRKDTEDGTFYGIKLEGAVPAFIQGVSHQYFLEEEDSKAVLFRISEEASVRLDPVRKLGVSGDISISIGKKHLSEFYYDVLPILQENMTVDEPDADYIESQMPVKAEFIIYLDAPDKIPELKIESVYDEKKFPATDMMRGGKITDSVRDPYREGQAIDMVRRYFDYYDPEKDCFWMNDDPARIYHLMNSGLKEFTSFCQVQSTARFDALRIRRISRVQVGVSIQSDIMNLTVSSGDLTPEELLEILKSYKQKQKYHRLPNGSFVEIDENIASLSEMMDALHLTPKQFISGKINVPAYRALYLDKMMENLEGIKTSRDRHFRELIKNFKAVSESDFEVPESLTDIMRPYQVYGYQWMRTLASCNFGGILADDMGLGKTLQMICVLLAVKEEGGTGTSLIVCPASLIYNWGAEIERFAPSLSFALVAGTKAERQAILEHYTDYDVLVTSYDLLKRDIPYYEDKQFDYQVLDEAQFIKTHTTAAAKSVKIVNSAHRFALTGTPIENRLSELWSIFDFLMPDFLYRYETFKKDFETPIVKNEDAQASQQLKKMVSPFILRRLKNDVLKDLPEKLEEVRYARFDSAQQQLYDSQVVLLKGMIDKSDDASLNQNKIAILAQITKTRQICCDPSLLFEDYKGGSAKKDACLDLVRSAIQGEHRILLFSQFTSMLSILEETFKEEGIEYFKITGSTPKQERLELVRAFNDGKVPLFLISLKAGGTGLNLTGADIVIHYDPWWNIAAQNQATDRAHRIGQTKTVCVYKLIARGTIEEKIIKMQNDKEKLADEILSGETTGISGMTRQQLMELLTV